MPETLTPGTHVELLSKESRIFFAAHGLALYFRDRPIDLFEIYMGGEANFIAVVKATMQNNSLLAFLDDRDLGKVYEHFCRYVKEVAEKGGKWRKRRKWNE